MQQSAFLLISTSRIPPLPCKIFATKPNKNFLLIFNIPIDKNQKPAIIVLTSILEVVMKQDGTVVWKTKIPKKLYNKINYYLKKYGDTREYFLNYGIDYLQLKYSYNHDFPDPETLYRFNKEDEAALVTWQVRISEHDAISYDNFISWYGITGRDALAAALYQNRN